MSGIDWLTQATVKLTRVDCASCGLTFAVSEQFIQQRRDDHVGFRCPNGHSNYYPDKSEAEILREQLAQTEKINAAITADLQSTRAERDHHWIERKKTNTRLRHLKERVKHGVCPCCHRTFKQLARHMELKHPGYAKETSADSASSAVTK